MNNVLLNQKEFEKLYPYMNNVINLEVKQYKNFKEVLLENSDGKKYLGNLSETDFKIKELKGLSSVVAYFARGRYGSNIWRGNCSGLLVKDLIEHFNPSFIIDPMCGSGTVKSVADELGIRNLCLDLNPKWGGFDALKMELPYSTPFIFLHTPYYVFPGSNMPQYSGKMWGKEPHNSDGSHIHDQKEFKRWFDKVQANLYQALKKDGYMAILTGDSRYKGQYYSMFKEMDIYGEIQNVIIKKQYNCFSDSIEYKNSYIPIEHETLIIIKKVNEYNIPCLIVSKKEANIKTSVKITWRALIQSTIEHFGGKATKDQILRELKEHPKAQNNNHLEEKFRQTVNSFKNIFIKHNGYIELA